MRSHDLRLFGSIPLVILLGACGTRPSSAVTAGTAAPVHDTITSIVYPATASATNGRMPSLSITLAKTNDSQGIAIDQGGDSDSTVETKGNPPVETRGSGNNRALPAADGNTVPDSYLQFNVDDNQLFAGKPTSHVRLEVEYFDTGKDTFLLQYDALVGKFAGGGSVVKTDTRTFKTAVFNICDAYFGNRDNGSDFRISDNGDGAEFLRSVRVKGIPSSGPRTINVDDFGANPFDDKPDSDPIQAALDSSCSGDTIVFTSGVHAPGYTGYQIDKTLFLTGMSAKHDLVFTSSDPNDHALLGGTGDLKGYVVRLYARSRFNNAGDIDNLDFGFIDINGGRNARKCLGADQQINGIDDNWGSWLPECTVAGDPWCSPGNIGFDGAVDESDPLQNYPAHPGNWTTGVVLHDLVDQQAECGSALAFGGAAGTIQNVTVDTAGDHVHAAGCASTDNDGDKTGWSDGMTIFGTAHHITGNTIIDPSDVGIVYFGGKDTVISNNTIQITSGNYGAFAGIAVHPWQFGDVSGVQVTGNRVTSLGDSKCGGLHAGINIGAHMWDGACVQNSTSAMVGDRGCSPQPVQPKGAACTGGACQLWAYIPAGATLTLKDNTVSGAHINYFVEGLDVVGQFVEVNNVSQTPRLSDWEAAKTGCNGLTWGALDKVAHDPSLPGWKDLRIYCTR